jgi:hypothetical protein
MLVEYRDQRWLRTALHHSIDQQSDLSVCFVLVEDVDGARLVWSTFGWDISAICVAAQVLLQVLIHCSDEVLELKVRTLRLVVGLLNHCRIRVDSGLVHLETVVHDQCCLLNSIGNYE